MFKTYLTRPDTRQNHGLCGYLDILDIWILGYFGPFGYLDIRTLGHFGYLDILYFRILGAGLVGFGRIVEIGRRSQRSFLLSLDITRKKKKKMGTC